MPPKKKAAVKKGKIPKVLYPPIRPGEPSDSESTPPRKTGKAGPVKTKKVHENLKKPLPKEAFETTSQVSRSNKSGRGRVKSSTDPDSDDDENQNSSESEHEKGLIENSPIIGKSDDESVEDGFSPPTRAGEPRQTYPRSLFKIRSPESYIQKFPGEFYSSKDFNDFLHVRSLNVMKAKRRKALTGFINLAMKGLAKYSPEENAKRRAHKNYILSSICFAFESIEMTNVCVATLSDIAEGAIYKARRNGLTNPVFNLKYSAKRKRDADEAPTPDLSEAPVSPKTQEAPVSPVPAPSTSSSDGEEAEEEDDHEMNAMLGISD
jgi:hypothetical protein